MNVCRQQLTLTAGMYVTNDIALTESTVDMDVTGSESFVQLPDDNLPMGERLNNIRCNHCAH